MAYNQSGAAQQQAYPAVSVLPRRAARERSAAPRRSSARLLVLLRADPARSSPPPHPRAQAVPVEYTQQPVYVQQGMPVQQQPIYVQQQQMVRAEERRPSPRRRSDERARARRHACSTPPPPPSPPPPPQVMVPRMLGKFPAGPMACPFCQATVTTSVTSTPGCFVWAIAGLLCVIGAWPCCLIPFCVPTCMDSIHRCVAAWRRRCGGAPPERRRLAARRPAPGRRSRSARAARARPPRHPAPPPLSTQLPELPRDARHGAGFVLRRPTLWCVSPPPPLPFPVCPDATSRTPPVMIFMSFCDAETVGSSVCAENLYIFLRHCLCSARLPPAAVPPHRRTATRLVDRAIFSRPLRSPAASASAKIFSEAHFSSSSLFASYCCPSLEVRAHSAGIFARRVQDAPSARSLRRYPIYERFFNISKGRKFSFASGCVLSGAD